MGTKEELNLLLETTKAHLEIEKEMRRMTITTLIVGILTLISLCIWNFTNLNSIDVICISMVCFSVYTQTMVLIKSNREIRILKSKIEHIEDVWV